MIEFTAAPSVSLDYPRLTKALTAEEISKALASGYAAVQSNPGDDVLHRQTYGVDMVPLGNAGLSDWRNRMFLVWFCYLFENFEAVRTPMAAIEELILEFGCGPREFDEDLPPFAQLYAGAGAHDPLTRAKAISEQAFLSAYYNRAIDLLERHRPERK
jgi:hypothetical protein